MGGLVDLDMGGIAKEVMGGLDDLFTSDEERLAATEKIEERLSKPHMMQAMANLNSANHPSMFVAGARPALMWLCVFLLAYVWVGRDSITIGLMLAERKDIVEQLPVVDAAEIMTLVLALLGLGGTRAFEKMKGTARSSL